MNHFDLKHILENRTPEEKADILAHEYGKIEDVLMRNGFVACDIPACNCGSWHQRYGLPERYEELKEQLAEARRDAERMMFCRNQFDGDNIAKHCGLTCYVDKSDKITAWELTTETDSGGVHWIKLGSSPVPAFTPEARAIIDAAMAAEEQTT